VTDYKKYALGQVENFLYDAMSTGATPQEIYDVIKGVVEDNYYTYKKCTSEAYELLALLNGNGQSYENVIKEREYYESSSQYTEEELNAMCDAATSAKKDKVKKWILPVDDDYNITFPEDLLEQTGWKEGDTLQWIDQGDGSFKMIKKDTKVEDTSVHENDWNKDYEV
jgi:bifunctional DNA-binding transcriptional regulator/antitoxin component of YhaV-PrlF toxin-antitoxin module